MQSNPELLNKVLNALPYPLSTQSLIQQAHDHGASDEIVGMLGHLPNKTFNSAQDVQALLGGGDLGGLGKLFG